MERSDSRDFHNFVRASSDQTSSLFDASQYDFFGKNLDEMSLGGLDDDEVIAPDDEYHMFDKAEAGGLGSLSDLDDLATTFAKLNRVVSGPKHPGVIGDRGSGSFSRESSSATDWTHDTELTSWLDERDQEANRWSSQSQSSPHSKPLYRTSSYPQRPPPLQHHNSEPIILPESTFTSFPPPGSRSQQTSLANLQRAPSLPGGSQFNFAAPSPRSSSSSHLSGSSHWPQYSGGNLTRHASCGPTLGNMVQQPHWLTDPGLLRGDHSSLLHTLAQQQQQHQQLPPRNDLLAQHMMALQQRQSYAHLAALQSQLYSSYPSPSSRKVPFGEHKPKSSSQRSRKNKGISQQASDAASSQKGESGLQFRSKYMTSEEIESILKMKHSHSHSNDPYVNDYYHQARLAKKSRAISLFYPSQLKDHQPRSRNSSEQHPPQVHVDALGKITLPYIRRPPALLEVDSSPGSNEGSGKKHLEQEPLVAARVTIEDALGVLIDIVDIDRHLQSTRPQDGGAQVKRKRQILLEGLATALQLADPFSKTNQTATKDDVVFLRIATLPKGRKMLTKYIQLLVPGTEIARVVCMAIFRHLRFLFGGLPSDALAAETTVNLAKAVTVCVQAMDLRALSACLAAVVCSSEQPPLRPIGSSAGDGASVVLISLLERAAEVVAVPRVVNDGLWRASFDEFFNLLTKYCRSKYETIRSQNQGSAADVLEVAIKREMPAELLRASIRHTSDDQRNYLLNFGRPSAIVSESASHARGGHINSESVRVLSKREREVITNGA
ncbi:Topoisomerase II-associated protein PAT1 [Raphanus sativus]|uniref:Protein PAT1 homolog 1 n=1 Tax=Raphanus sativus TaxID=3726 RepID=A0A6J0JZK2_RAPSA|nr:protein PAT1 homolog 1 [Raphanus sativus]KAJ4887111.1 Topoisomerase II-associated protein PAT1 [Raphanus sativus]